MFKKLMIAALFSIFCISSINSYHARYLISSTTGYGEEVKIPSIYIGVYIGDRLKLLGRDEQEYGIWKIDSYDSAYLEPINDTHDDNAFFFKALKEGETIIQLSFKSSGKIYFDEKARRTKQILKISIQKDDPEARAKAHAHLKPDRSYDAEFFTLDDAVDIRNRYPSLTYYCGHDRMCRIKIPSDFPLDLLEQLKREKINFGSQWELDPYIKNLLTREEKESSKAEFDQMINAIPISNHYIQNNEIIFAKVNEPFIITVKNNYRFRGTNWKLNLDYKYFSSILALIDEETTSFILTPTKSTTTPLFFDVSWEEILPCPVVPPISSGETIPFVVEISGNIWPLGDYF